MNVTINPKNLVGDVIIPPSKSLSHRAIIAACLSEGRSEISNVLYSDDIIATLDAMEAMGAKIERLEDKLIIDGSKVKRIDNVIDAHESGSTIRFLIPIALTINEPITFIGRNHLVKRPLDIYTKIFDEQGIKYFKETNELPLYVEGAIKSGVYEIRGDISSQFITGLLYALPLLEGDSKLVITTNLESKGYVDLTIDILKMFNIEIINYDYKEFTIKGNQVYKPFNYTIEGDYSQVAFWLVAQTLGADLNLLNMREDSYQGDKKIIEDINALGGDVKFINGLIKASASNTKGAVIDFSESPDLGPALTVLASLSEGESRFINASRLRIKECDRITCMRVELEKMGAKITEEPDKMIITGVKSLKGNVVLDAHNDHRIAMALSIASLKANGPIKIMGADCVKKSYPHFYKVFESLKGDLTYEE